MTGINNAAYFLKEVAPETDTVQHKYLGLIRKEVGVASRIIDNLMSMTRLKESVKKRVDLAERVHDAFDSLEGKGDLRLQCKPERFEVHADPNQLRQVLINLLTNAAQAMDGTGLIVVEARHEERFDVITIADEGPGIPVEARDKIFEPLYTTKAKGIGLGLFICRQIIERNGGMMDVVQTQAPGAVFRIRLPRVDTQQTESITDGESANSGR